MTPNPPTEPIVEKWEKEFDEQFDFGDDTDAHIKDFISDAINSSVQEAKAEERERIVKICEEMKVVDNVTIPVCRKCNFFGTDEDYCPKCGDNLTPETSTGHVEKIKNSLLDDLLTSLRKGV